MAFEPALIEEILNQANIVDVISSFIPVIRKGKAFVAKCPFHDDSNPSMMISPEKKIFKCFVCGTAGNAISFVQKYLNIPYPEAVKKVADIIGFRDPRLEQSVVRKVTDSKKESLLKCLQDLTLYYEYALSTPEGKEGLDYLNSRNLDENIRAKYKIGYAFKDGRSTVQFLQSKGHSLKTIEDTGVAALMGGQYTDKNQGRVVFSICDAEGNVIGYSARKIRNTDEAKYVNSPETYLFHKSSVLYNYHIAKDKARIAKCIYVCEGFMDVFALAKIGMDNAVAIMGTALTKEHIAMLRSLNVEIRLCLDGDLAGQTAMMKASKQLAEAGLNCVIVDNRGSTKDPDEILNQDGPEVLRSYLEKVLNRVDFSLNYFENSNPLNTSEEKRRLVAEFIPILLSIKSQLEFDSYLRKLATITGYDVESIREVVKKYRNQSSQTVEQVSNVMSDFHPERKALRKLAFAERELLYQMATNPAAVNFYEEKVENFYDETYRQIANYLVEYAHESNSFDSSAIIASLEQSDLENKNELINELTGLLIEKNHPNDCNKELLDNLYESIQSEKNRIFEEDTLEQSLAGKDPLEQARIISEYNRRKAKKNAQKKEDR